jgi:HK97 gp10 family phage protein
MGRSHRTTTPAHFDIDMNEMLEEYTAEVLKASDEAVDEAAKLMKERLEQNTPRGSGKTASSWRVKKDGKKRIIRNTRKVKGKKGGNIPLVNILEYSTVHGHPFVQKTYTETQPEILAIFEKDISKIE